MARFRLMRCGRRFRAAYSEPTMFTNGRSRCPKAALGQASTLDLAALKSREGNPAGVLCDFIKDPESS